MALWLLVLCAAPFVLALVLVCLRDPMRVALPIYAALIPFGGALSVGPSRYGSLSSLVGILLAGGLLLQLVTARRAAPRLSMSVPIWLLFLGVAGATTLWTIDRSATISGIAVLASLIVVYALVAVNHVDRTIVRRTENGLLLGAVASVCYGLYQLIILGGFPGDTPGAGITPDGRFGNDLLGPGVQAISLLLPLVIALNRVFQETDRRLRARNGLVAALILTGVLMTGSRAGAIAVGIVLVTLALASPRRARNGLLACTAVGVAVVALVWVYHPAGLAVRTFDTVTSSSGRTDIWEVGLSACTEYCPVGAGWGTYPQVYAETQAFVPGARVLVGNQGSYQAHNLWLLAAVELGIAGLILLTWGLGTALYEALRLPGELRGPPLSAVVGLIFGVVFLSSMEFKFFWMLLIMIALYRNLAAAEAAEAEQSSSARSPRSVQS